MLGTMSFLIDTTQVWMCRSTWQKKGICIYRNYEHQQKGAANGSQEDENEAFRAKIFS